MIIKLHHGHQHLVVLGLDQEPEAGGELVTQLGDLNQVKHVNMGWGHVHRLRHRLETHKCKILLELVPPV